MSCVSTKPPADAKSIKLVILDIDGVLTDGQIGYGLGSDDEVKFFDVHDGHGIKMLQRAGLRVGVLSGRESKANDRRARELQLDFVLQGRKRKDESFLELVQQQRVSACQCLYMGDDLIDIPVMLRAGISVAPANAAPEVAEIAHWVCAHTGGRGAVREMAVRLLQARGTWQETIAHYYE